MKTSTSPWLALLLVGTGLLGACSEEETPAPTVPDTTGKGNVTTWQPNPGTKISSNPTFSLRFNGVIQTSTVITGQDCASDSVRLQLIESKTCEELTVSYSTDQQTLTVTPRTQLKEGTYELRIAGSVASSLGTLGTSSSNFYTVVFPYGGAIQNPLSLSGDNTTIGNLMSGATDNPPRFNGPQGLASNGSSLFVADTLNASLRHLDLTDDSLPVRTLSYPPAFPNESVLFEEPVGVTLSETNLYVLDRSFDRVISIPITGGTPTLIAGGSRGFLDGIGIRAQFNSPEGITNTKDALYIADTGNNNIRRIDLEGNQTTSLLESTPGIATPGGLNGPRDLTTDGSKLYIADTNNCAIKEIDLEACGKLWDNCTLSTFSLFSPYENICDPTEMPMSVGTDSQYLYVGTSNRIQRFPLSRDSYTNDQSTSEIFPRSAISPRGLTTDGQSLFYSEEGANRIVRLK